MINRRHIRVKVMQSVYAILQSHNDDILREEKFLKHSILKSIYLYILELSSGMFGLKKSVLLSAKIHLKTKFFCR